LRDDDYYIISPAGGGAGNGKPGAAGSGARARPRPGVPQTSMSAVSRDSQPADRTRNRRARCSDDPPIGPAEREAIRQVGPAERDAARLRKPRIRFRTQGVIPSYDHGLVSRAVSRGVEQTQYHQNTMKYR
jgi:hypothetical protein